MRSSGQQWCATVQLAASSDVQADLRSARGALQEIAKRDLKEIELRTHDVGTVRHAVRIPFSSEEDALIDLRARAAQLGFDLILHSPGEHWRNYKLIVFDLDSTLITCEGIDEFAAMMGVGERVSQITAAAMRGELDFEQSFRRRIALLRGLSHQRVTAFVEQVKFTPGAELLIRTLKQHGYRTAIASGGFDLIATRLQRELGIDDFCANCLDIADGCATGEVPTRIIDGQAKRAFVLELAARHGISAEQVIVVGDGANDIPMMQVAGLSVAFHGKPKVVEQAKIAVRHVGLDGLLYVLQLDAGEHLSSPPNC